MLGVVQIMVNWRDIQNQKMREAMEWRDHTASKAQQYFMEKARRVIEGLIAHDLSTTEAVVKLDELRCELSDKIAEAKQKRAKFEEDLRQAFDK